MNNKGRSITKNGELYISVDIEASGPIPSEYSMLSIGACVVGSPEKTFYVELKPLNNNAIAAALIVSRLSLDKLKNLGVEPAQAMNTFRKWIIEVSGNLRPIFVGFNAPFDWQFINWYFHRFFGENPFGISAIDIKAYYMGYSNSTWEDTSSSRLPEWLKPPRHNAHNALEDAVAQSEIFFRLLTTTRKK